MNGGCSGLHVIAQHEQDVKERNHVPGTILREIYDAAHRANPYPLWAKLRQTPVSFQEDGPDETGTYVVSTYREIEALLHDPRISSDLRNCAQSGGRPRTTTAPYGFISLDPPEHDRLRGLTMRHFGPPQRPEYLEHLRPEIARIVTTLLDQMWGQRQIDFVERFAYPLPVTVICRILGVPLEDEPKFHVWASSFLFPASTTRSVKGKCFEFPACIRRQYLQWNRKVV
jgi:cytochrome P450